MRVSRKFTKSALLLAAAVGLALQPGSPASAHSPGAMTGWESPDEIAECGLPQSGFAYNGATFSLKDSVLNTSHSVEVTVGAFRAAPQGVVSGVCTGDMFEFVTPIIPGAVTITSATVDGSPCNLAPSTGNTADTYQRINTTVVIGFDCGSADWSLVGNQNVCTEPLVTGATVNPECLADVLYPDPDPDGSPSHFVVTYTHS